MNRRTETKLNMKLLSSYLYKAGPLLLLASVLIHAMLGMLPNAELWLTGQLINQLPKSMLSSILPWLAALLGIKLLAHLFAYLSQWIEIYVREKTKLMIKKDLLLKSAGFNLDRYENSAFHDQMLRAYNGMEDIFAGVVFQLLKMIELAARILGLCWLLSKVHWLVPLLLLAGGIPVIRAQTRYNEHLYNLEADQSRERRLANYYKSLLIHRTAAKEIRLFGLGAYFIQRWQGLRKKSVEQIISTTMSQRIRLFFISLIQLLAYGLSLFFLIYQLKNGRIGLGEAVVVLFAVIQLQESWEWFIRYIGWLQEDYIRFTKDLISFLRLSDEPEQASNFSDLAHRPISIQLKNVCFSYPHSTTVVLNDINLAIPAGEKVVIVGENGSGKSTLIKLLLGFYKPSSGQITIEGLTVAGGAPLQQHSTVLFQDYMQYHLSLRENIGFGSLARMNSEDRIQYAAEQGGAGDIAERLKGRYEAVLGPTFGGSDLSGGQWQMVGLSRVFMKDSCMVILDEPTSAFDPKSEGELYERYIELTKDKTAIFISHRLGFAKLADRIIVLKDGTICESGNHQTLLDLQGEYFRMWKAQASLYA